MAFMVFILMYLYNTINKTRVNTEGQFFTWHSRVAVIVEATSYGG